jgi:hypothetical protein
MEEQRLPEVGDDVLYVYPEGDCDNVKVINYTPDREHYLVMFPNGVTLWILPEEIGAW